MSAKYGRLNVFFVRVNCSIWDPPNSPKRKSDFIGHYGGPYTGVWGPGAGWGGGGARWKTDTSSGMCFSLSDVSLNSALNSGDLYVQKTGNSSLAAQRCLKCFMGGHPPRGSRSLAARGSEGPKMEGAANSFVWNISAVKGDEWALA